MNTQRPEWNDANNALVGKGLSVVTLCYLRRYLVFFQQLLKQNSEDSIQISVEIKLLYTKIFQIISQFQNELSNSFNDQQRRSIMDELGQAGSDYRWNYYSLGLTGDSCLLSIQELSTFLDLVLKYFDHTLRANKRNDDLYHAYNILNLQDGQASVSHLYEMFEGQVAVLSSGMLSGKESLALLEKLKKSKLYRADQHSYILYPDRVLAGFLEKNCISPAQVSDLKIVTELEKKQDISLFTRDEDGNYHFSGHIHNLKDVQRSLSVLNLQPAYSELVKAEADKIAILFESCFHHNEFTGRSGSFFAYEGLGSIYWHMVSKLVLAVQETIIRFRNDPAAQSLIQKYKDICEGLPINKTPQKYGAFPSDPYSHTPKGHGARQPGMTGMVKEEILSRLVELGLIIQNGCLEFNFILLDSKELLNNPAVFSYWNVSGKVQHLHLTEGSLVYTFCQVPIVIQTSNNSGIDVHFSDGSTRHIEGCILDSPNSAHIFQRDDIVHHLEVGLTAQ